MISFIIIIMSANINDNTNKGILKGTNLDRKMLHTARVGISTKISSTYQKT